MDWWLDRLRLYHVSHEEAAPMLVKAQQAEEISDELEDLSKETLSGTVSTAS